MKFRRAFNWGVIVVGDANPFLSGQAWLMTGWSGVNALALGVRHSSDVELDDFGPDGRAVVRSRCRGDRRLAAPPGCDRACDSGSVRTIRVGDAEAEEEINVRPGQFQLTIDVDERAHPGVVRVWITEAASD